MNTSTQNTPSTGRILRIHGGKLIISSNMLADHLPTKSILVQSSMHGVLGEGAIGIAALDRGFDVISIPTKKGSGGLAAHFDKTEVSYLVKRMHEGYKLIPIGVSSLRILEHFFNASHNSFRSTKDFEQCDPIIGSRIWTSPFCSAFMTRMYDSDEAGVSVISDFVGRSVGDILKVAKGYGLRCMRNADALLFINAPR